MSTHEPPDSLGEAFGAVAKRLRAAAMEAFAAYDVTPAQVRALRVVAGQDGGVRASELARQLRIAPRSVTEVVDALEAKGLVARQADAEDRRRNVLELTEDGHTALARAVRASDEAERQLLAELDDDESAQLRTLLTRLARDRSER